MRQAEMDVIEDGVMGESGGGVHMMVVVDAEVDVGAKDDY